MKLARIFEKEPLTWGSRGNPYFWNHLKDKAQNIDMPISAEELEAWIKEEHLKVTGEKLTPDSAVFVKEYNHGGMSSGIVYGEWWFDIAIPLLKERLQ